MKPWLVAVVVQDHAGCPDFQFEYFDDEAQAWDRAEYIDQSGLTCYVRRNLFPAKPSQAAE